MIVLPNQILMSLQSMMGRMS